MVQKPVTCFARKILKHVTGFCPRTPGSWCKYQREKLSGKKTYRDKLNIPPAIVKLLKPIFSHKDLGSDSLLSKCLHGKTQNPNESLHNMSWKRCPKRVHCNRATLEIAVASSVISFNVGQEGLRKVFDKLFILPGHYCLKGFKKYDSTCAVHKDRKTSDTGKKRRKKLRRMRKGFADREEED